LRDPLAVGVVRLIFHPQALRAGKPVVAGLTEPLSDLLDIDGRRAWQGFEKYEAAIQGLLDDGMEALAVIPAPTIGPRIEKRA